MLRRNSFLFLWADTLRIQIEWVLRGRTSEGEQGKNSIVLMREEDKNKEKTMKLFISKLYLLQITPVHLQSKLRDPQSMNPCE